MPRAHSQDGRTALLGAAAGGHTDCARLLLAAGACVEATGTVHKVSLETSDDAFAKQIICVPWNAIMHIFRDGVEALGFRKHQTRNYACSWRCVCFLVAYFLKYIVFYFLLFGLFMPGSVPPPVADSGRTDGADHCRAKWSRTLRAAADRGRRRQECDGRGVCVGGWR